VDQPVYFVADGAASFIAGMRDYLQFGRLSKVRNFIFLSHTNRRTR
jgi:hypothetical protein